MFETLLKAESRFGSSAPNLLRLLAHITARLPGMSIVLERVSVLLLLSSPPALLRWFALPKRGATKEQFRTLSIRRRPTWKTHSTLAWDSMVTRQKKLCRPAHSSGSILRLGERGVRKSQIGACPWLQAVLAVEQRTCAPAFGLEGDNLKGEFGRSSTPRLPVRPDTVRKLGAKQSHPLQQGLHIANGAEAQEHVTRASEMTV